MRKTAQLSVRITSEEMESLRELASRESVLLSQLVRGVLAINTKKPGPSGLDHLFADDDRKKDVNDKPMSF